MRQIEAFVQHTVFVQFVIVQTAKVEFALKVARDSKPCFKSGQAESAMTRLAVAFNIHHLVRLQARRTTEQNTSIASVRFASGNYMRF